MGEGRRAQLRAGVVVGFGLLLALAATLGPAPSPSADPGASLTIRLPDAVRALVLGLLGLSALLLLAMQRPRRPADGDPLLERVYQRRSPWAALLSLAPILVLAVLWYVLWNSGVGDEEHPIERAVNAIAGLIDLLSLYRKPPTSVPFLDATIAVLALLFALGVFALMVVVTLAERLERWWAGGGPAAVAPVAATADDRDDLRAVADARAAIIRAYARFERVLAAARLPRAPWQTPAEYMRATLALDTVPGPPVERLTTLFEVARFSDRPLAADARDAACDALDAITAAVEADAGAR